MKKNIFCIFLLLSYTLLAKDFTQYYQDSINQSFIDILNTNKNMFNIQGMISNNDVYVENILNIDNYKKTGYKNFSIITDNFNIGKNIKENNILSYGLLSGVQNRRINYKNSYYDSKSVSVYLGFYNQNKARYIKLKNSLQIGSIFNQYNDYINLITKIQHGYYISLNSNLEFNIDILKPYIGLSYTAILKNKLDAITNKESLYSATHLMGGFNTYFSFHNYMLIVNFSVDYTLNENTHIISKKTISGLTRDSLRFGAGISTKFNIFDNFGLLIDYYNMSGSENRFKIGIYYYNS